MRVSGIRLRMRRHTAQDMSRKVLGMRRHTMSCAGGLGARWEGVLGYKLSWLRQHLQTTLPGKPDNTYQSNTTMS